MVNPGQWLQQQIQNIVKPPTPTRSTTGFTSGFSGGYSGGAMGGSSGSSGGGSVGSNKSYTNTGGGGSWGPSPTTENKGNNGGGAPAPSGYGTDPNFRYTGWDKDFGTGAAGQAAYEAYRNSLGLNASGQFDQAAYDQQLNNAYAPAYQNLDDVQKQYESEYPTSQAFINQSYAEVLPQLQTEKNTRIAGLDTQAAKGKTEKKNQIGEARQKYNELRTGGLTRFGGSSSTGEAYGELLGRATSQEMGGITKNFGQYQQDIEKERANVNDFYANKKTSLEKEKQLKLQELKNTFDSEIRKINSSRTALDTEKAAKRMAAIQEFSVQARQAQYDAQAFAQKLDAWKAAKDETIQLAQQFGAKSFTVPSMPGVMGGFSVTGQNQPTSSNYISGQGSYTPEDLKAMGLSPTTFNSKTGAMTYGQGDTGGLDDNELAKYLQNL